MRRANRNISFYTPIFTLFFSFQLVAQTGFLPPNPISPPKVTPPTVTATTSKTSATPSRTSSSSSLPSSLNELTNPAALLNALGGAGGDTQGLDVLTSLLGGGTTELGGTAGTSATDAATMASLEKILGLLEKQQAQEVTAKPERITSGGEIVRFTVNGLDIEATTTSLISSILTRDGSFLLTGNRTYVSSARNRSETFYLLFKKTAGTSYRLFADVSQDYLNEYSYLYQLVRKTPLSGTLTGDLLVFRTADPAWNFDLVIRIITPTVSGSSVR